MKKTFLSIAMVLALGVMIAPAVFAQVTPGTIPQGGTFGGNLGQTNVPSSIGGVLGIVLTVIRWFYTIIFIVAVAMILLAAFHFVTSKGDPTKTKTAKSELQYAIIGIAVALVSYGIVAFVQSTVQSNLTY
ncbi:MAG: hypothetical protein M1320_01445 [Patescibacteria group bacterium]|nr:hypothetical protein [Patescibacteria group bacterium]